MISIVFIKNKLPVKVVGPFDSLTKANQWLDNTTAIINHDTFVLVPTDKPETIAPIISAPPTWQAGYQEE